MEPDGGPGENRRTASLTTSPHGGLSREALAQGAGASDAKFSNRLAEAEQDSNISGRSGPTGARIQQAMNELLDRLHIAEDAREKADDVMGVLKRVVAETSSEQKSMRQHLRKENERMLQHMEERHAKLRVELEKRLETSERVSAEQAQALDDSHDKMKGLEARQAQRIKTLRAEYTEELDAQKKTYEEQLAEFEGALHTRQEELETAHALAAAAIGIQEEEDGSDDGIPCEERRKLRELEAVVMSSREKQSRLTDELSELRLQMLGMEHGHEARVDDMQRQLWEAQQQLLHENLRSPGQGGAAGGGGKPSGRRGAGMRKMSTWNSGSKLTSIEEEDKVSVDGSAAASGALSGVDSSEIGNLHDFDGEGVEEEGGSSSRGGRGGGGGGGSSGDEGPLSPVSPPATRDMGTSSDEAPPPAKNDKSTANEEEYVATIEDLKAQLAQARLEKSELQEDLAGREAELESKVQRLTEMLRVSRDTVAKTAEEKESAASKPEPEPEAVSKEVAEVPKDNTDVEALKHELFLAVEAKRIASNRLEDMRQELEATQRRCEQTASELRLLRQKTESMEGQLNNRDSSEIKELTSRVQNAEEQRNVLQHTLEWKEVQWKSKMEHLELEHAELKRRQEGEVAKLKKQLDDTISDFKRKLDAAEQEKAALARSGGLGSGASGSVAAGGLLALLRCPTRLADSGGTSYSSGATDAAHCREVGWRLLGLVQGAMALLCEVPGLKVLDVTEGAKTTWGEGLAGSLVVSLLASPTSAAWLRRAIVTHQNLASLEGSPGEVPGFAVHTLGQLEFRDGGGRPFESAVSVAHLPVEPKLGKAATVVVVMEPLAKAEPARKPGGSRRSALGGGTRAGSAVLSVAGGASVVSDDVLPSDSASNIAARYM